MKVFLCPSDASTNNGLTVYTNGNVNSGLGGTIYYAACNYAHNFALFATRTSNPTPNYSQAAYTIANIPDGTSNTISFTERIGNCGSSFSSTRDLPTPSHDEPNTSSIAYNVLEGGLAASLPLPQFGVTKNTCTTTPNKTASSAHAGVMVIGLVD